MAEIPTNETVDYLKAVIEWAIGKRGSKDGNPYMVPEVKAALQHLGDLQGGRHWAEARTFDTKK